MVHSIVELIEDGGEHDLYVRLDSRTGTLSGTNVEFLRRRAHDQLDAFTLALAQRVPPGPDLEYPDVIEDATLCVATSDAALVAELLAGAARMLTEDDAYLLHELEGQLRVQMTRAPR